MRRAVFGWALLLAGAPASAEEAPICADRPAKATGTCTVPAGRWQVETGLADWTLTRAGGARSDALAVGASLVKFGLDDRSDIEIGLVPYVRVTARGGGSRQRASGFGDIVLRYKLRLSGDDAPLAVAVEPYVKLPTASHQLGNGKLEGGLVVPASLPLGGALTLAVSPEADLLADGDGHGRHAAFANAVNVSAAVTPRWTIGAELWGAADRDPAGTIYQASADVAAAYAASPTIQLDAGANLGLTRSTADVELYAGVSKRF